MREASLPHSAHFSRSARSALRASLVSISAFYRWLTSGGRRPKRAEMLSFQFGAYYEAVLERRYGGAALERDDGPALDRIRRPEVVGFDGHEVVDPERVLTPVLVFDEDLITGFHVVEFVEGVGHPGPWEAEGVPRDKSVRALYPGQTAAAQAEYAFPVELGLPRPRRHGHVLQPEPRYRDTHGRRSGLPARGMLGSPPGSPKLGLVLPEQRAGVFDLDRAELRRGRLFFWQDGKDQEAQQDRKRDQQDRRFRNAHYPREVYQAGPLCR